MHLLLVGLPGSGKTSVGRAVAARLARPFLDLDRMIEQRSGRTVRAIFEEGGEPRFRALEVEATRELLQLPQPAVVAVGGGWASNPSAVALLDGRARMIHLRVSPEGALRRLGLGVAARPLLAGGDPLGALRRLAAAREQDYARAAVAIDVENIDLEEVTDVVVRLVGASGDA